MSVINTNITSMIGQSNLNKSQNALQTSMERLSSGLRINSAKDDAAGQAIANRMTAQITGLAQTAEGSLNQINDNLQRIRELASDQKLNIQVGANDGEVTSETLGLGSLDVTGSSFTIVDSESGSTAGMVISTLPMVLIIMPPV